MEVMLYPIFGKNKKIIMKKNNLIVLILLISSIPFGFSQEKIKNSGKIDAYNFTPKEYIYVHFNSSLLFAGEYLYYKVYCLNSTVNKLSSLSKVAYVELIDENKQQVFRHKITLKAGLGQGDFFISTNLPSGNYKIIAYTQWMKNGGENYFYRDDISILNPYLSNQKNITDSINNAAKYSSAKTNIGYDIHYLKLTTNGKVFKNRSKVSVSIENSKNTLGYGNYSLSVRKLDTIHQSNKLTANSYKKLYPKNVGVSYHENSEIYDPEINGGVIYGRVLNKNTNLPAKNQNVSISIPGENFIFKTEITNDDGEFDLSINEAYENDKGIIQVLGENRDDYRIEIDEMASVDISRLEFNSFKITPSMKDKIIERSVYNQIENGYYEIKPDTIISSAKKDPFYTNYKVTTFVLDDYTRFYTVKDVFVEIIENVWSTTNKDGNRVFYVSNVKDSNKNHLPLIFIDGVLIQNHQHLLDYKATKIKEISVLQGDAHFGNAIYQGVIIVKTNDGDYKNQLTSDYLIEQVLFKAQPQKNYFHQTHNNDNKASNRVPDFRNQLLWEPKIIIDSNEEVINFYTSDNSGEYEICLEGFTNNGLPISLRETFTVK